MKLASLFFIVFLNSLLFFPLVYGLPNSSGTYKPSLRYIQASPLTYKSATVAPIRPTLMRAGTLEEREANEWQSLKRNNDQTVATYAHQEAPSTKVHGYWLGTTNPQRVQELGQSKTTFYHQIAPNHPPEPIQHR